MSKTKISKLSEIEKAYIAGFLDGDGSINAQIVFRKDYNYIPFQIRVYVGFYQKKKRNWLLKEFQKQIGYGSVNDKSDGIMSDYIIVGEDAVKNILLALKPFIKLKKPQVKLIFQIIDKLPKTKKNPQAFLELCEEVDRFMLLNDSKKRTITTKFVRSKFLEKGLSIMEGPGD
jgi:hypothetical protein